MSKLRVLFFLMVCFLPSTANAGPWPRAEGTHFLSLSVETDFENGLSDGSGLFGSIYFERGIRNDLTLGFDASHTLTEPTKAIGFVRWPIGPADRATKTALEFGVGLSDDRFALRPGFSWGRGIAPGDVPGWVVVDSRAVIRESFDFTLETDFTFGLRPAEKSMVILQLQTGMPRVGEAFAKFAPSYVHQVKPGRRIEVGLVTGIMNSGDFKLKLGLWREF